MERVASEGCNAHALERLFKHGQGFGVRLVQVYGVKLRRRAVVIGMRVGKQQVDGKRRATAPQSIIAARDSPTTR